MKKPIGIIGTGAIAEAVVIGLCTKANPPEQILLSPRNSQRANRLAEQHSNVAVARDNQSVLNNSSLLFIAVRPQVAEDILLELQFKPDQTILSFMAGVSISRLKELVEPAKHLLA